ncbi:MAG: energy-coupling factor transporter transmembrane protein EcfT [Ruminococcaceae bacterium]|nr:energy-coupling factor transporter transmembrane protein EcfT [Oscillospiraceae bacterium]
MISDITLGQFFPGYSPIHKLDPRTKIILATLFIVAVFVANNPASFLLIGVVALILVAVSRISMSVILKGIKPILFILLFTALINIFMTKGEGAPLVEFWIIKIYKEGIIRAILMALRVIILIIGTSILLTYTTSPIALTDGLESLLSPLKKIKVPVHTFAMMMSIALRFIPTLVEETEKIMNAQKSRGADFTSGSLVQRAKALVPILIPLFVSSFKRAEELATAMECRCYRGDVGRTKMVKLEYRARDYIFLAAFLLIIGLMISLAILPYKFELDGILYGVPFYKV